jgi:hypothetical protein
MRQAGVGNLALRKLIEFKIHGLSATFIRDMQSAGA